MLRAALRSLECDQPPSKARFELVHEALGLLAVAHGLSASAAALSDSGEEITLSAGSGLTLYVAESPNRSRAANLCLEAALHETASRSVTPRVAGFSLAPGESTRERPMHPLRRESACAVVDKVANLLVLHAAGGLYGDPKDTACYVINLSHQSRSDRFITVWRACDQGYAWPLSWAGVYPLSLVKHHAGYYNNGSCNIAVPCCVLDELAEAPPAGTIDGNAGPVVFSTRENWEKILANLVIPPFHPPRPQLPRSKHSPPLAGAARRSTP